MGKPIASLSLDLDDQWTYMKTHGDPEWSSYPSYLDYGVPRILDFLEYWDTKITFFLVAQDAAFDHNREVLAEIARRGHDIGNHTFHHDPWLHIYSEEEIDAELARAEEHIEAVTGVRPLGFRGPGFSFSDTVLRVLARRGYEYDASTFPNILNPLARLYFLWSSNMSKEERAQRKGLFGSWKDGLRPVKPFEWNADGINMLEIPVTTMPLFKVPIHASYILFLSTYSAGLAKAHFHTALDFIGSDDTSALSFFPAMRVESQKKIDVMNEMFLMLQENYQLLTMAEHARMIKTGSKLARRVIQPS